MKKLLLNLSALPLLMIASLSAGEIIIKDSDGGDCYVYVPDTIDLDTTYQVIVGVHGARGNGKGAAGLASWANRGDVIVMGPSFNNPKVKSAFQYAGPDHDKKLIKLFKEVGEKYKVCEKMFVHGFSGGSQFVHRFAMNEPKYVCGVSAHSGGTWATGYHGTVSSKAKGIPHAISCGEKDTKKSFDSAPHGRLEWFNVYQEKIDKKDYTYIGKVIPNAGHNFSGPARDLMKQCFQIATGLPGSSATEKVEISADWKNLGDVSHSDTKGSGSKRKSTPTRSSDSVRIDKITSAAIAQASTKTIDDDKLISFLEKYPATLWKEKAGAAGLYQQCSAAVKRWREKAEKAGKFSGSVKAKYDKFTSGLDLD